MQGQKPKTLFCYLCGREFGTTSLSIHLKSCTNKFHQLQQKKTPQNRIKMPAAPIELEDILNGVLDPKNISSYNEQAIHIHKYSVLPKCRFCSRTFNEQSLQAHENGCAKKGNQKIQDKGYAAQQTFSKPRTLTCNKFSYLGCVCGRQFGLTSLKIHYPQCVEKFENEEMKKMKAERKATPKFSQEQIEMINSKQNWTLQEIESFNNRAAVDYRQKAMVQCPNCGRKFIQASYLRHQKNCVLINGDRGASSGKGNMKDLNSKMNSSNNQTKFRATTNEFKKPRTLTCCVCGREFGLTSLKIHYPQCVQKFQTDEKKKPKNERKPAPLFSEQQIYLINTKDDWTLEEIEQFNNRAASDYRDKAMVQCENCGRKFLESSYLKHKKNCILINGERNQSQSKTNQSNQKQIESEFKKPRVLMCFLCGREFGLTSLTIHQAKCSQKFMNQEMKKSPEERRPIPEFPEQEVLNFNLNQTLEWPINKIEEYNSIANEIFRQKALYPCYICGRKFFQQSLPKHLKFCEKNKQRSQSLQAKNTSKLNQSIDLGQTQKFKQPILSKKNSCPSNNTIPSNQNDINDSIKEQANEQSPEKMKKKETKETLHFAIQPANFESDGKISEVDEHLEETWKNGSILQNVLNKESTDDLIENEKSMQFIQQNKSENGQQICSSKSSKHNSQKIKSNSEISDKEKKSSSKIVKKTSLTSIDSRSSSKSIKQNSLQKSTKLSEKQTKPEEKQIKPDQLEIITEILSPILKAQMGMGFAAPRKKQQNMQLQMKECKICKRKFDSDRVQKHEKLCFDNAEKKKKSEKSLKSSNNIETDLSLSQKLQADIPEIQKAESSERDILSVEDKVKMKKGFAEPRNKEIELEMKMIQCKGCKRKFAEERIQKHQSICKLAQQLKDPFVAGTYKKMSEAQTSEEKVSFQRTPCPKCNRKFAQQRIQKHMEVCKVGENKIKEHKISIKLDPQQMPVIDKQSDPKIQSGKNSFISDSIKQNFDVLEIPQQKVELQACQKCNRKFKVDRISKHQEVCKGKITLEVTDPNATMPSFRRTKMTSPKQENLNQQPTKQYNLQNIEVKDINDTQRVQCPKCFRKFVSDRIDKHINICKSVPPLTVLEKKQKPIKTEISPKVQFETQTKPVFQIQEHCDERDLAECEKCNRKFLAQRLEKHFQTCKGSKVKIGVTKHIKFIASPKMSDQKARKTTNDFFNMAKNLKEMKVKNDDIDKSLEQQLFEIQTTKLSRKENNYHVARENKSLLKKKNTVGNKSALLPKI